MPNFAHRGLALFSADSIQSMHKIFGTEMRIPL